ncbi:MAG: MFS transporter [Eubacteriales bacterium]|nr:MFS transporter [Eubacteriales bacterium]
MRTFYLRKFDKPILSSKIKNEKVTNKERWLGFCIGPALVTTLYAGVSGSYLNSFYTDVLGLNALAGGTFLALLPIISKILDAVTNILMGQIVDNTRSSQGKARPWILLAGPLLAISAIFLFSVPRSNMLITAVWVVCSYNLFFAVSYTMYNLSNVAMIPLSTRDNKQRDKIAMASSIGLNIIPGLILAFVFPSFLLPLMGVDQTKWILVMSILAVLAIPGTLIQYYCTKERVTEEVKPKETGSEKSISLKAQVKGCLSSRYWVLIMLVCIIYQLYNNFSVTSMLYYSNWVLGSYNDGKTLTILNVVGQAMLGPGIAVLWPLVGKIGKQKVYIIGSVFAVAGGVVGMLNAKNLMMALVALTIRSIGTLPITYLTLSMVADALDHVEWKSGYRCDGFSSSIYSIIITLSAGISMGIFNLGLSMAGYIPPAADGSFVVQTEATQKFFISGMYGLPAFCALILLVIFCFFNLESKLPQIREELELRRTKN